MTLEQAQATFKKLGYTFFEKNDFNLNIVAIRENQNFENNFSDTLLVFYKEQGEWKTLKTKWTTLAGTLGFGGEQNPLNGVQTGTGVNGVAIIQPGQYRRVFKFIDNYWQWLGYPYFQQITTMHYWRDNNRDGKVTKSKTYIGNYATNLHRMSNNSDFSNIVNSQYVAWSQGCNGSPEPEFKKLVELVRKAVKIHGDVFSYTILENTQISL